MPCTHRPCTALGSNRCQPAREQAFSLSHIQTVAFVSGGALPAHRRGTSTRAVIHISDWFATLCAVAHVAPHDAEAAAAGLPAVDSVNIWPFLLSTNNTFSRSMLQLSANALLHHDWKLVVGAQRMSLWTLAPSHVNASTQRRPGRLDVYRITRGCGATGESVWPCRDDEAAALARQSFAASCCHGCLYNLSADVREMTDVGDQYPDVRQLLLSSLSVLNRARFSPNRGSIDRERACSAARGYGGVYGPFV